MDKTQQLLEEEDGIKLINTCDMQDMSVDDLRKSLGPSQGKAHFAESQMHLKEQLSLLRELEKVKQERDEFKKGKDQLQREILNQTFGKCFNFN